MLVRAVFILTGCLFITSFFGQGNPDKTRLKRCYSESAVYDSTEGIKMYDRLIEAFAGDSVRRSLEGYNAEGWQEDRYTSGELLHRGFYKNGRLVMFKNFYRSGNCERNFSSPDPLHFTMDVYYENGGLKKQLNYFNSVLRKTNEYHVNGLPKNKTEYDKEGRYIVSKKTWYADGKLESELKLLDSKTGKYSEKHYHPNGHLKEEGLLVFYADDKQYIRNGVWHFYDSDGKNKTARKY